MSGRRYWIVTAIAVLSLGASVIAGVMAAGCSILAHLDHDRESVVPETGNQWSTAEFVLRSVRSYANPYTEVAIRAIFTGPHGVTKAVSGFWDGENRFKIRFSPTLPGLWTFSISSVPVDRGLRLNGTLRVTGPHAGNHGFLRRDREYPYSFVFDDGTRYFMMGQTYYEISRNARAGGGWRVAVEETRARGMNKVRLLVAPWNAVENSYPATAPFLADNHDKVDLAHWQALDEVVGYLKSLDVVAELILFADTAPAFGTQVQDQRYVGYAVARFAAYQNVIWSLTNEWNYTKKPKEYWNRIGALVRDADPWISDRSGLRPLSIHQQTRRDFQFFDSAWPVHAVIQYGVRNGTTTDGDRWGNAGIVYNLGRAMPVVNDEYGYIGESAPVSITRESHRNIIWGIVTAGGYGTVGDGRLINGVHPIFQSDWTDAPGYYDDVGHLTAFWNTKGIEYWKMQNKNGLVGSGERVYVFGLDGREYVVYAATGDSFSLDLPPGTYLVEWFDPSKGMSLQGGRVSGGGRRFFSVPLSGDAVLHLKAMQDDDSKSNGERAPQLASTLVHPF
jgi:Domain of unknown function (DUF5060)